MLGRDGLPRVDLFREDCLHLNEAGYALWAEVVRPELVRGEARFEEAARR
jgi:lysophospholipase L1-like esterase